MLHGIQPSNSAQPKMDAVRAYGAEITFCEPTTPARAATLADVQARTGWMGRYLDRVGEVNNAVQGLSLEGDLSPALATERVAVSAASVPRCRSGWDRPAWCSARAWTWCS